VGTPRPDDTRDLLTAADGAELLGTTERYVWALGRRGLLPRVVLPGGRLVRFTRSDVDAMIAAGREGRDEQPEARPSGARRRPAAGEQTAMRF
jgi:predicted DNA-binding transcriptional regulator AlpA